LALQRLPYPGRPGWRGRANLNDAELRQVLQTTWQRPGQLAVHVVGDAATDRLFQAMKALAPPAA
jgi:predicted amidohydrolase YtcJ